MHHFHPLPPWTDADARSLRCVSNGLWDDDEESLTEQWNYCAVDAPRACGGG